MLDGGGEIARWDARSRGGWNGWIKVEEHGCCCRNGDLEDSGDADRGNRGSSSFFIGGNREVTHSGAASHPKMFYDCCYHHHHHLLPRDSILSRYVLLSCLSVCLSVCDKSVFTETAMCSITQTTPHDSPQALVFRSRKSRHKLKWGPPNRRRQIQVG